MPRAGSFTIAQEADGVLRVDEQPQVREHVAVLLALEERQALHDLERDAVLDERAFRATASGR